MAAEIAEAESRETHLYRGTGTILLVDDEETIIELGRAMLETLGYDVITAESGSAALEIFGERHREIALVVMDMIMPSGFSREMMLKDLPRDGLAGFIQKPFEEKSVHLLGDGSVTPSQSQTLFGHDDGHAPPGPGWVCRPAPRARRGCVPGRN